MLTPFEEGQFVGKCVACYATSGTDKAIIIDNRGEDDMQAVIVVTPEVARAIHAELTELFKLLDEKI